MANIIKNKIKENPKLLFSTLSDGRQSLYLEYYIGYQKYIDEDTGKEKIKHNRRKEYLELYLVPTAKTPEQKRINEETITIANKIRFEREQEFKEDRLGYRLKKDNQINVFEAMYAYIETLDLNTIYGKRMKIEVNKFKRYIGKHYPLYREMMYPNQLTPELCQEYINNITKNCKGEGGFHIYHMFRRIIKNGLVEKGYLTKNPCTLNIKIDRNALTKDILSMSEIQILLNAKPHKQQNMEVRRAFTFSLFTGIRLCDIKRLTYKNVDYTNKKLKFNQNKTKGHSSASWVTIPLNEYLIEIIGEPKNINDKIFMLPNAMTTIQLGLKNWCKYAGVKKHITWHCARHSFATNILSRGANIKTVSSLLGHSSIKMTEKYTRVVDELKADAINSLINPD